MWILQRAVSRACLARRGAVDWRDGRRGSDAAAAAAAAASLDQLDVARVGRFEVDGINVHLRTKPKKTFDDGQGRGNGSGNGSGDTGKMDGASNDDGAHAAGQAPMHQSPDSPSATTIAAATAATATATKRFEMLVPEGVQPHHGPLHLESGSLGRAFALEAEEERFCIAASLMSDGYSGRDVLHRVDGFSRRLHAVWVGRAFRWTQQLAALLLMALTFLEPPYEYRRFVRLPKHRTSVYKSMMKAPGLQIGLCVVELLAVSVTFVDVYFMARLSSRYGRSCCPRRCGDPLTSKYKFKLFVACLIVVDVFACLISGGTSLRISRVLRPLLFIMSWQSLAKGFLLIGQAIRAIREVIALVFMWVALFAVTMLLANAGARPDSLNKAESQLGFKNFVSALNTFFFMLFGSVNYPDDTLPHYITQNWGFTLAYAIFLVVGVGILLNIFLAVVYSAYTDRKNQDVVFSHARRKTALLAAFRVMDNNGSGFIEREDFDMAFKFMDPAVFGAKSRKELEAKLSLFWYRLDSDSDRRITRTGTDSRGWILAFEIITLLFFIFETTVRILAVGVFGFFRTRSWLIDGMVTFIQFIGVCIHIDQQSVSFTGLVQIVRVFRVMNVFFRIWGQRRAKKGSIHSIHVSITFAVDIGWSVLPVLGKVMVQLLCVQYIFVIVGMEAFGGRLDVTITPELTQTSYGQASFSFNASGISQVEVDALVSQYPHYVSLSTDNETCTVLSYFIGVNFDSFGESYLTLFMLFIVNNWHVLRNGCAVACGVTAEAGNEGGFVDFMVTVYFVAHYVIVVLVIFNIVTSTFLDVFVDRMQKEADRQEEAWIDYQSIDEAAEATGCKTKDVIRVAKYHARQLRISQRALRHNRTSCTSSSGSSSSSTSHGAAFEFEFVEHHGRITSVRSDAFTISPLVRQMMPSLLEYYGRDGASTIMKRHREELGQLLTQAEEAVADDNDLEEDKDEDESDDVDNDSDDDEEKRPEEESKRGDLTKARLPVPQSVAATRQTMDAFRRLLKGVWLCAVCGEDATANYGWYEYALDYLGLLPRYGSCEKCYRPVCGRWECARLRFVPSMSTKESGGGGAYGKQYQGFNSQHLCEECYREYLIDTRKKYELDHSWVLMNTGSSGVGAEPQSILVKNLGIDEEEIDMLDDDAASELEHMQQDLEILESQKQAKSRSLDEEGIVAGDKQVATKAVADEEGIAIAVDISPALSLATPSVDNASEQDEEDEDDEEEEEDNDDD
eukprot:g491.t1